MRAAPALICALITWACIVGDGAHAHDGRPLFINITEQGQGLFTLRTNTPASVPPVNTPRVSLPACHAAATEQLSKGSGAFAAKRLYLCAEGLSGAEVKISYPVFNPSLSTLVRITWASGEIRTILAGPQETSIIIPAQETVGGIARGNLQHGIRHILSGIDHLLFITCLMVIAGTWRRMLLTVTGFTLAHSLTLALSALEIVRLPGPPIEAAIALSIVFLAAEIVRNQRRSLIWRNPIMITAAFGLLHGFGFASALREFGLPHTEILTALVFFNIGVEAGQIAFVFVLSALFLLARAGISHMPLQLFSFGNAQFPFQRSIGYVVGTLSAFWVVIRVGSFWS
jgi:hydrogenase/urease accessory protein HupE